MRFLTLEQCKKHVYVEHDEDDSLIELYARAAENSVERYLERDLSKELSEKGSIPEDVIAGMLLFFGSLYANREGFTTMPSLPSASIQALLRPYKTYGIVGR